MAEHPQLLLPFAEREFIDVPRTCRILGVAEPTVRRLAESGLIQLIEYAPRRRKRIRYQSVVDFCDRLRHQYGIPDRRPTLSMPYFRHRDEDLLPFPLSITMSGSEVRNILACSELAFSQLLSQFECYQLVPQAPWRVSRPSFTTYFNRVRQGVAGGPRAYKVVV